MQPPAPAPYAPQPMDLPRMRVAATKWGYVSQGAAWALAGVAGLLLAIQGLTTVGDSRFYEPGELAFVYVLLVLGAAALAGVGGALVLAGLRFGTQSNAALLAFAGLLVATDAVLDGVLQVFQGAAMDFPDSVAPGILLILAGGAGVAAYATLRTNQPNAWMRAGMMVALGGLLAIVARSMLDFDPTLGSATGAIFLGLAALAAGLAMALHGATHGQQRAGVTLVLAAAAGFVGAASLVQFFGSMEGMFSMAGIDEALLILGIVVGGVGNIVAGIAGFVVLGAALATAVLAAKPLMEAGAARNPWTPTPAAGAAPGWPQPAAGAPMAHPHAPTPTAAYATPAPPLGYAKPAAPAAPSAVPVPTLLCPGCHQPNPAGVPKCATCGLALQV